MSKTNIIVIAVIAVYLLIIVPKIQTGGQSESSEKSESKSDAKSGTGLNENADKNGVSQGAAGQQRYRIGYTQ